VQDANFTSARIGRPARRLRERSGCHPNAGTEASPAVLNAASSWQRETLNRGSSLERRPGCFEADEADPAKEQLPGGGHRLADALTS
jgi:hypothetical protein